MRIGVWNLPTARLHLQIVVNILVQLVLCDLPLDLLVVQIRIRIAQSLCRFLSKSPLRFDVCILQQFCFFFSHYGGILQV